MKSKYDDYNSAPEELRIIPVSEWRDVMFNYQTGPKEMRQVRNDPDRFCFDLIMFAVPNFDETKKIGVAVMMDWWDNRRKRNRKKTVTRFCKYGKEEDWKEFEHRFAAQFAGDNS